MTPYQVLNRNIEEIRRKLQEQETMLRCLDRGDRPCVQECCLVACPHRQRLATVLVETIEVLDATRRAFKSKQLESLRKRLIQELADQS